MQRVRRERGCEHQWVQKEAVPVCAGALWQLKSKKQDTLPWWDHHTMDVTVEQGARTNKTFLTLDKLETKNGQAKKSLFLTSNS